MSQEDAITQNCYGTVKSYNWGRGVGIKLPRERQDVKKVIKSENAFMIGKQMGFYQLTWGEVEKIVRLCFIFLLLPLLLVFLNDSSNRPFFL